MYFGLCIRTARSYVSLNSKNCDQDIIREMKGHESLVSAIMAHPYPKGLRRMVADVLHQRKG